MKHSEIFKILMRILKLKIFGPVNLTAKIGYFLQTVFYAIGSGKQIAKSSIFQTDLQTFALFGKSKSKN